MSEFEKDEFLEKEFNFNKAIKNPYIKMLQQQVTISLDENVVKYFKKQSDCIGIPYQALINLYLRDCMTNKRRLEVTWK